MRIATFVATGIFFTSSSQIKDTNMQLIAFLSCWALYLAAIIIGVLICALIGIAPSQRTTAKRFAAGLIGSVPGVAVCQFVALPVVAAIVGLLWTLHRVLGDLTGVGLIIWGVIVVLGTVGLLMGASLLGFQSGWTTGMRLASGVPFGAALRESKAFRLWHWVARRRS